MSKGFNYSKWDKIELSDDESDVHPNIDKDSWFRLKHRTRIEREEKEDAEMKKMNQLNSEDQIRLNIITARLNGLKSGKEDEDAEFEDLDSLRDESNELTNCIKQRNKKMDEYLERRKWNIDNICKTKEEKTIVNSVDIASLKADDFAPTGQTEAVLALQKEKSKQHAASSLSSSSSSSSTVEKSDDSGTILKMINTSITSKTTTASATALPAVPPKDKSSSSLSSSNVLPSTPKSREKFAMMSYNDYVLSHEALLEHYSVITDMEDTKKYLFQHCDVLLHEHAQSYMLLSCLEDEMNNKKDRMKRVCRQCQILSHITELGAQMHRDPRDVILPFFRRMEEAQYLQGFLQAVEEFRQRIVERAKVKRREMEKEERAQMNAPLGPGGLDPLEVLESLPEALRVAFESQEISKLQAVIASMNPNEAKYHMKRCVDSGLWVANDSSIFEDDDDDDENKPENEKSIEQEVIDNTTTTATTITTINEK